MSSPKRRRVAYSQNFLRDRKLVSELVERSTIGGDDVVVEIGPGKGIITDVLAERSRHVITIEKDPIYAEHVSRRFGERPNVTVFACDILEFPLPETPFKVFASIPYRITAAIIERLTTGVAPPTDAYLAVQREAAARFAGLGEASMVSTCLKPWFTVAIAHHFRRRDFVPQPSVDSVLLHIAKRDEPLVPWDERERFCRLVEAIYSAWQPTVAQALRKLLP
ncbi:MAG TPA: rRNA adenine N(6)-methyltransferase family protein, partial [Thermomicrobiales bacterium]|nr:rRNA adenine N(6)-methyltransferase family protein [Thermomicrobiales bacterium]